MLLVQKYLETHTFADLIRDHGVYASFSKSGHKFSLNYDQIEAKESDPLAQECRGLVLAPVDGKPLYCEVTADGKRHYENIGPGKTVVLAYPMKRFFNHGQGSAAEINWSDPNLAVLEKLDGTLCIVYHDFFTHEWCVATRSVSEADLLMDNGLFTFRTLFEKSVQDTCGYTFSQLTSFLDLHTTYCFELTTPYNRIVVNYPNNTFTLLAVRSVLDHQEVSLDHECINRLIDICVPVVKSYTYTTITELLDWVSSLNPMEHEGVVVRDSNFNRIKVKNATYVAYNKVRDTLATSERNCVELILAEKDDDVAAFLPEEIVKNIQKIKSGLQIAIQHHDQMFKDIVPLVMSLDGSVTKKDFAIMLQRVAKEENGKLWAAPLFEMFDGKVHNMKDFIQKNRKNGTWGDSFLDKLLEMSKKLAA